MTLCIAWIRDEAPAKELVMAMDSRIDTQERTLVVATDSRLTGGERWDSGVKLFELPRRDCLLCFAGSTFRAYPLILNSISSIKFDQTLTNSHTDIHEVLDYLIDLFTNLVNEITDISTGDDINRIRGEAQFLFGGWSWKKRQFGIWRLYYEPALAAFTHESINPNDARVITFIGDHIDEAKDLLEARLRGAGKLLSGTLDMEPLQVLAQMSRDTENYRPIGGALQVAKIYQSGTIEFFGVMWPSAAGQPTFLGRLIPVHDMPSVRLFDPDSALILEDPLPDVLAAIDPELYGPEVEFVAKCYPDGQLKADLSKKDHKKLRKLIHTAAYKKYCNSQLGGQEAAHEQ